MPTSTFPTSPRRRCPRRRCVDGPGVLKRSSISSSGDGPTSPGGVAVDRAGGGSGGGEVAIPMVREQMELILEVQTDEWWQDVTVPMFEALRRRLRDLVKLIEKQK